jgi:YD repeat-containing protein
MRMADAPSPARAFRARASLLAQACTASRSRQGRKIFGCKIVIARKTKSAAGWNEGSVGDIAAMATARRSLLQALLASALYFPLRDAAAQTVQQYTYDALGRVTKVEYADGSVIEYEYDDAGNRTEVDQDAATNAPTGTFTATPLSIRNGQSATLTWVSTGASTASIDSGVGIVTPASGGSVNVSPSSTTTYTLTLTGANGMITKQATVTVTPAAFTATIAIPAGGPVNLRTLANSAGFNGAQNASIRFTLAENLIVQGTTSTAAIDTGTWPTSSYAIDLDLELSGIVRGGGGNGGTGAENTPIVNAVAGGAGGDALRCQAPIDVVVNPTGRLFGGGGGGGGGGGWSNGSLAEERYGGGGGGGFPNGSGSDTGGAAGSVNGGGSGGAGQPSSLNHSGGDGGTGGGPGESGAPGVDGLGTTGGGWTKRSRALGGAAGYAIRKNGHTVNVLNNGVIAGPIG